MREMLRDGFGAGARATSGRLSTPGWVTWSVISFGITAVSIPTQAVLYDVFVPIAFVLGILQGGSVLLAALRPWWGAVAQLAAIAGFVAAADATGGPWPMPVLGMIALGGVLVALGLHGYWGVGAVTWLAAIVLLIFSALVTGAFRPVADEALSDLIVTASTTALGLFAAAVVAQLLDARVEVREAREQTEIERAHVLWQQERARIAREMHDVVAHSMSIVHMRATSARYRLDGLGTDAVAEFDGIAEQARAALREMRGLLGVLREGDGVLDAPQPGLADLPALLEATRDAGVAITASLPPEVTEVEPPASLQLALYRVAQESLSNVVRHARGAEVFVGLERVGPELWLTIENGASHDGDAEAGAASDQGGHGIRGMMERMASVGGSLDHGTVPGGGYRVVARAPHPLPSPGGTAGAEGAA
jgi:signal transduction histidine kinase